VRMMSKVECKVCFRHCRLEEGETGFCGSRICAGGIVRPAYYGRISALALDPIEKKPLRRFYPGSRILSAGSFGCNLRCPFCQNSDISWSERAMEEAAHASCVSPLQLARAAADYQRQGNIGLAFTYNEPLVAWEFVRDTARLINEQGMKNVLVTNGTASLEVLEELTPYIDAMNIDLKGFTDEYYRDVLGGSRQMVMAFIERAVQYCHVEITTLVVPGENDSEEEMRRVCSWIAGLKGKNGAVIGKEIPLHISRFFPRFHMTDRGPTSVAKIYHLAEIARQELAYVYTGNC